MELFVSLQGNDSWSGRLPEPNTDATDGPLATVRGARERIRGLRYPPRGMRDYWEAQGIHEPITVLLRGGVYALEAPLYFSAQDSAPVTYAAYPGETPILDGGTRITGWELGEVHGLPCWVAAVPEVAAGAWYFQSLFVNGERRSRPRLPKEGEWYWIADAPGGVEAPFAEGTREFTCRPGDILPWHNISDVEAVVLHYWVDEHMRFTAFDQTTNVVTTERPSIFVLRDDKEPRFAKYYVSNVFEALCEPGQWYLDRVSGKLYYLPLPGETPETAEVYAPRLTQLLRIEGKPEENAWVDGLTFRSLTFRHTDAVLPPGGPDLQLANESDGVTRWSTQTDYAAAPQAAQNVPGVIACTGARNCAFTDCVIEHVGWYGLALNEGCSNNRIVGCTIADLGAGGVRVGGADAYGPLACRTGYNRITDNHIHHAGRVFHQAVGVFLKHSFGNVVAHNHIHDLFYTGISCGWIWGYAESVSKNNRIEKNHIHHLGFGWLSDMGGVYTLGVQPGTVVRGNLIHDIEKANYGGWALYPDEGSSHIIFENNVCYDTSSEVFHQHYGRENTVRNNIFAFGREGGMALTRADEHFCSLTAECNIIIVADNASIYTNNYRSMLEQHGFRADVNLLWHVDGAALNFQVTAADTPRIELSDVQALGFERHSLVADPHCADLAARDFTLADDSPAFALGFHPIDLSDIGPRPPEGREV
ncbi:MAG TPA: right-handed parallel beta-helix repeat-containing protein [Armatimonadota bacterium]|jgi:hypothetical protein